MNVKEQYWKYSLVVIILLLGTIIFFKLRPFLGGLLGACTIYVLLRGQMRHLILKKKMKRSRAAALLLSETILCFLIPLSLIVWLLVNKVQNLNLDPQSIMEPIQHLVSLIKEKTGYDVLKTENLSSIASVLPQVGQFLMGEISGFAINVFVLVFVLYFMLIGGSRMEEYIYDILPFNPKNKRNVLEEVHMLVRSNAIGIPLLAVIQGGIAMSGYFIFDAPSALLFGLLTCFATIIPIVGTAIIWFPLVAYMAITGDWGNAIGLLIYALVVITNIDNLIRFILQKKMADTHPLITIFGVVIGLPLFGFMGVIFGPLMLSLFILCVDIFKTEYLDVKKQRWIT